jgi:hypothetical protein
MRNRYTVIVLNKETGQELFRFKTVAGTDGDEKKAILDMIREVVEAKVAIFFVDEHEPTYEERMADIDKIVNNAIERIIKERYRRIEKDQDEPDKR